MILNIVVRVLYGYLAGVLSAVIMIGIYRVAYESVSRKFKKLEKIWEISFKKIEYFSVSGIRHFRTQIIYVIAW